MLRKTVQELGTHSLIYFLGGTASALASIVLLPVYTRFLSKTDYGILEIIDSSRYLLGSILMACLMPAMAKFFNEADSEETQRTVVGTILWCLLGLSGIAGIWLFLYDVSIARALLGGIEFVIFIDVGIFLLLIQVILTIDENYLNIYKRSKLFLLASLSKLGLNVGANLYGVVHLRLGAMGMLYGELVSTGMIGGFLTLYVIKQNALRFRRALLRPMLAFGVPFIPNMLSAVLMHRADRYLLQRLTSLADVGVYGLGYKFPFMLNALLLDSFGRIWYSSVLYDVARQQDSARMYAKITTYVVTFYVVCQYMLAIMASTVIKILAAPEYFAAWKIVQIVSLGLCCYSIYNFFVIGAYIKSYTWFLPISHLLAAFLNIVLNWYLLPHYGYIAAAWNTVLTYLAFSALNFLIFRKKYPIPYEFGRLGVLFGTGILLVVLNNMLSIQHGVLEAIKQLGFAAILPLFLLFGPYLDREEKASLAQECAKWSPKLAGIYAKMLS